MAISGLHLICKLFCTEVCAVNKCDGLAQSTTSVCMVWNLRDKRSFEAGEERLLHKVNRFPFSLPILPSHSPYLTWCFKIKNWKGIGGKGEKWLLQPFYYFTWGGDGIFFAVFSKDGAIWFALWSGEMLLQILQRQSCGSCVLCLNSRRGENRC